MNGSIAGLGGLPSCITALPDSLSEDQDIWQVYERGGRWLDPERNLTVHSLTFTCGWFLHQIHKDPLPHSLTPPYQTWPQWVPRKRWVLLGTFWNTAKCRKFPVKAIDKQILLLNQTNLGSFTCPTAKPNTNFRMQWKKEGVYHRAPGEENSYLMT